MAASLIASSNPVGVWGETDDATITITWDTDSAQRGRVYLSATDFAGKTSIDNVLFDGDAVTGSREGTFGLTLTFGRVYWLSLRRVPDNFVMAALKITVIDLKAELNAEAARGAALDQRFGPAQAIHDLTVTAGIDTCRVRFKTLQPTIPLIQATGPDGTVVAKVFPLFLGMRTEHEVVLGGSDALPQDSEFALRITAAGHTVLKQPIEAVSTCVFKTGRRHAKIEFLEINVRKDGDPSSSGDGDFNWQFGAGDASSGTDMGQPWPFFDMAINDDDPPVAINSQISIDHAPRRLWVQAMGKDDDETPLTWDFGTAVNPSFEGEGSRFQANGREQRAWVTRHFDLGGLASGAVIPMELATADFDVAFTVKGRITLTVAAGRSPLIFNFSDWVDGGRVTQVPAAGSQGKLGGKKFATDLDPNLDGKVPGHIFAKGADGTLYRQVVDSARRWRADQGWMPAAPAVEGPVTAVLTQRDRIALFTIDRAGAVLRAELDGSGRPGDWRSLGGRFTGAVSALAHGSKTELVTSDAEGAVYHRVGDDWQRIGTGVKGEPAVVALNARSFAVFALSHRGEVLMKQNRDGRWQSKDWQVIEGATGIRLGAAAIEGQGVALAVIGADMKLTTLAARDAQGLTAEAWSPQGDLQAWLTRTVAPRRGKTKAKPEKKSRQLAA